MARVTLEVTMKNIYSYEAPGFGYNSSETRYIYTMEDADGKQFVWKTSTYMTVRVECEEKRGMEYEEATGKWFAHNRINRGDLIKITATVKGEREYKGQPQTELTRVKVLDRIYDASVEMAQKREAKKADQLASLRGEDFVWEMPYRQYKERYADCETVVDSFDDHDGRFPATIKVIIREGRLKASGVRGGHYSGYEFTFCEGGEKHRVCYRAISEETAMKRLLKEFPNAEDITPGQIYDYMAASDFLRDHFW